MNIGFVLADLLRKKQNDDRDKFKENIHFALRGNNTYRVRLTPEQFTIGIMRIVEGLTYATIEPFMLWHQMETTKDIDDIDNWIIIHGDHGICHAELLDGVIFVITVEFGYEMRISIREVD
jgi:hypothetical protein